MKYIDIHSHLNLSPLLETQKEVMERMKEKGVATITVGTGIETSREAVRLADENDFLYATVGIHPNHEEYWNEELEELSKNEKVIAIGECGLDYFRNETEESKIRQKEIFKKHIELALKIGKPLMIHSRPSKGSQDAYEEVLNILEGSGVKANFHFFVGNVDTAKKALEAGHTMSFDGPITFSGDYDEVIRFLPLESIMAETDAPYAPPVPHRGKVCEPWMVEEVYRAIARIKGLEEEQVRLALVENAKRFFDIKA
jgi:TatD DNase family protein